MRHLTQNYQPSSVSQNFVDALWVSTADHNTTNHVLPDGCSDIIIRVSDDKIQSLFIGPMTTAVHVPLIHGDYSVGIRFKSGVLLEHGPHRLQSIRDSRLLITQDQARFLNLELPHLLHSSDDVLDYLDHWLTWQVRQKAFIQDQTVNCVLSALDSDPLIRIQALYRNLDINPRALERRFLNMVGVSPKFYARIKRQQWAAQRLTTSQSVSFSALAQDLGYADQAHFIRDFQALTGVTPRHYQLEHMR